MLCHCLDGDLIPEGCLGVVVMHRGGGVGRMLKGTVLPEVCGLTHESFMVSGRISKKRRMDGFIEVCLSSDYQTMGFMSTVNCIITDGGLIINLFFNQN